MKNPKRLTCLVLVMALLICCAMPAAAAAAPSSDYAFIDNGPYPMTVSAYIAYMTSGRGTTLEVLKDGAPVPPEDYVATGQTQKKSLPDGTYVETAIIVVMGDVLGTGEINLSQLTRLAQAISGADPLEGPYLAAADLDESNALSLTDLVLLAHEYADEDEDASHEITAKSVTMHLLPGTPLATQADVELYFVDGFMDIPYLSAADAIGMMVLATEGKLGEIELISSGGGLFMAKREAGGAVCTIDSRYDAISFSDYNLFFQPVGASTCLDIVDTGLPVSDSVHYLSRPAGSFERLGTPVYLDLREYDIDLVHEDETVYLPMQTLSDVFTSAKGLTLLYNGNSMIVSAGDQLNDEAKELYYSDAAPAGPRSEALAAFNYNELCFALDTFYGLREQHDVSSFDELCIQAGIKDDLLSTDPIVADRAMFELTEGYLGDVHTCFRSPSWYAGEDADVKSDNISSARREVFANEDKFKAVREKYFPDGCPSYQEVGNTAYITFDEFTMPDGDYYESPPTADSTDTIGIIMYAHSQIMRAGSPVENVVIDLSANGGGAADAGVYVLAWCFGGQATLDLNCTTTGAQASTVYALDANADGISDENDTIASKNLFCLASGASFSCGNLVPCYFKASDSVTLLGQPTAGGACAVMPLTTADGTFLRISGPLRISTMVNGSYYDVDRGAHPDHYLSHIDHFYDREFLTEYVNTRVCR